MNLKIRKLTLLILIRNVRNKIIKTDEFYTIKIFINDTLNELSITTSLIIETHLITNLKVNIFININIIISQEIYINLKKQLFIIKIC